MWRRAIKAIRTSQRWQFWIKVVLILCGAVLGTIGGGMDGSLRPPEWPYVLTLKGALVVIGGGMSFIGGLLLLLVDEDTAGLLQVAREVSRDANSFLLDRDALAAKHGGAEIAAERLDRKRRERLSAMEVMLEVVEAALLRGADVIDTADKMLLYAIHSVRKAVEYEGDDFFTVSIFKREDRGNGERLYRIAAQWSDPVKAGQDGRSWAKGEGYTGVAWSRAIGTAGAEVIEHDTSLPHISQEYPVANANADREALYRSVAAIPILVGESDEVWGVVTATSDRKDVFRRDMSALGTQNVAVIRDIARFAGLLAGIDKIHRASGSGWLPKISLFGRD